MKFELEDKNNWVIFYSKPEFHCEEMNGIQISKFVLSYKG